MVTSFEISTSCMLERLKELETANLGERPQTAVVLDRMHNNIPGRPEIMNRPDPVGETQNRMVLGDEGEVAEEEKEEMEKCVHCDEMVPSSKMAPHTI